MSESKYNTSDLPFHATYKSGGYFIIKNLLYMDSWKYIILAVLHLNKWFQIIKCFLGLKQKWIQNNIYASMIIYVNIMWSQGLLPLKITILKNSFLASTYDIRVSTKFQFFSNPLGSFKFLRFCDKSVRVFGLYYIRGATQK